MVTLGPGNALWVWCVVLLSTPAGAQGPADRVASPPMLPAGLVFAVLGSCSSVLFAKGSRIIPLGPVLPRNSVLQPSRAVLTACLLESLGTTSSNHSLEGSLEQLLRAQRASSNSPEQTETVRTCPWAASLAPGVPQSGARATGLRPRPPPGRVRPWSRPPTRLPAWPRLIVPSSVRSLP